MTSPALVPSIHYRRLSLAAIDAVVSARLGPTRIQGNAQPACFNRQSQCTSPSMSLVGALHASGVSTMVAIIRRSSTASNGSKLSAIRIWKWMRCFRI